MSRRRRWVVAALVALLGVPGLTVLVWPGPASVGGIPSLPAEFAGYSPLTGHAEDRPAGRAIVFYETGSWEYGRGSYQALVVGADRDSYRQVRGGGANSCPEQPILLSPDGSRVLRRPANGADDELELLDLTTGTTSLRHGVAWTPASVINWPYREVISLLAWSPDGRYVAYLIHSRLCMSFYDDGTHGAGPRRQLAIVDLIADRAVLTGVGNVVNAAFAPDSRRLAVAVATSATDTAGIVLSTNGTPLGIWPVSVRPTQGFTWAGRTRLHVGALGMAWSPDGATLAVSSQRYCGPSATLTGGGPRMTVTDFIDLARGQGVPDAPAACLAPLGWRSPTTLVGAQIRPDGGYGLAEVSLVDGWTGAISQFSYRTGCEIISQCDVWHIQLATNLLGPAALRHMAYPDRGPVQGAVHVALADLALVFIAAVIGLVRRRRVRRPADSAPPREIVTSST